MSSSISSVGAGRPAIFLGGNGGPSVPCNRCGIVGNATRSGGDRVFIGSFSLVACGLLLPEAWAALSKLCSTGLDSIVGFLGTGGAGLRDTADAADFVDAWLD